MGFPLLIIGLLLPLRAAAAPELDIPRFEHAPKIDGLLDDPAWLQAARAPDLTQFRPNEGVSASERTVAYLGYDSNNLYAAFYCVDSDTAGVRGHLAPRDQISGDDWVGIILDPHGDQRRAMEFFANPMGIQLDLFSKGGNEDVAPDFVWFTAGKPAADGFVVEMRIPLKTLRFSKKPEQRWRVMAPRTNVWG
ncbi:MAG: carbohydrate binding family 9 domain-containing protein [Elusimicrobia bacterium]|nr:carbohydrate binding family 9 domain-containing protein [Elusimicrobiota bacterium]